MGRHLRIPVVSVRHLTLFPGGGLHTASTSHSSAEPIVQVLAIEHRR
jgi:hypothetical protein